MSRGLPQRQSLINQTVQALEERIYDKEWISILPSERALSQTLAVGRDTIRKALKIIEKKGIIYSPQIGGRREINTPDSGIIPLFSPRIKQVGLLSSVPIEKIHTSFFYEIYKLEEALSSKENRLSIISKPWVLQDNPEKHLEELILQYPCILWILYRCPQKIQEWFAEKNIPCLVRGQSYKPEKIYQLDTDWEATAHHAAGLLWRNGHTHASLIIPKQHMKGIESAARGFKSLKEETWTPHFIVDPGSPQKLSQMLTNFHRQHPEVTAITCSRPRHVLTCYSWATSLGIKIPDTLSLVSLAYEHFLDELYPSICCYNYNPQQSARRIVKSIIKLLNGESLTHSAEWIIPACKMGKSLKTHLPA